jgi:hypothetical protein
LFWSFGAVRGFRLSWLRNMFTIFICAQRLPQHIYYFKWTTLFSFSVYIYIYIYMCIYIYTHTYTYTRIYASHNHTAHIFILITRTTGHAVAQFVEALRYKSEGQ